MKKTYNLKSIMKNAWNFVKKFGYTMSRALKASWANAKAFANAIKENLIDEEVHTHFGWTQLGYQVVHGSHNVFQITVIDPRTNKGTRVQSFFTKSQVAPIEA